MTSSSKSRSSGLVSRVARCLVGLAALLATAGACRIDAELADHVSRYVSSLVDLKRLESLYWPSEPLDAESLKKALGVDVTFAETKFERNLLAGSSSNSSSSSNNNNNNISSTNSSGGALDVFVACTTGRDRVERVTINLELANPFQAIRLELGAAGATTELDAKTKFEGTRVLRVQLAQSSVLASLEQRVGRNECLGIRRVQLAPNIAYRLECESCEAHLQPSLERLLDKRMAQFDAELDHMLSDKLLMGLHVLFDRQRLELDAQQV